MTPCTGYPRLGRCRPARPDTIVSGLPLTGDHPMHPFAINDRGELFVDVATATNSCQKETACRSLRGSSQARA
jgi:hypothetical protein